MRTVKQINRMENIFIVFEMWENLKQKNKKTKPCIDIKVIYK